MDGSRITYKGLRDACERLGHPWFTGAFNLNVVVVRTNTPGRTGQSRQTDRYDDWLAVAYEDDRGEGRVHAFPCTSEPGLKYLRKKLGRLSDGTPRSVIIAPGHHKGAWDFSPKRGFHKGYRAGRQVAPMRYAADTDRDDFLDLGYTVGSGGEITELPGARFIWGLFLTNLHRAHRTKILTRIFGYSAGCVVLQRASDLKAVLDLVAAQARRGLGWRTSVTVIHRQALR